MMPTVRTKDWKKVARACWVTIAIWAGEGPVCPERSRERSGQIKITGTRVSCHVEKTQMSNGMSRTSEHIICLCLWWGWGCWGKGSSLGLVVSGLRGGLPKIEGRSNHFTRLNSFPHSPRSHSTSRQHGYISNPRTTSHHTNNLGHTTGWPGDLLTRRDNLRCSPRQSSQRGRGKHIHSDQSSHLT